MLTEYEVKKKVKKIVKVHGERHVPGGGLSLEFWSDPRILRQFQYEKTAEELREYAIRLCPQV